MKTTQSLVAAFGIGILTGFLVKKGLDRRQLSSEQALGAVKSALKKRMDIDGAWIYLHPEEWENGILNHTVYHGGLTEDRDDEAIHYDFIVDATTGTVLELKEQA